MKYNIAEFPAHLTFVGELNGEGAYAAAGRRIMPYPAFVTAPQSVAKHGELVIEPHFTDVVVYPELFLVIGENVEVGKGNEKAVLGYGVSLGMYQNSLVEEAKAKGGTPRDLVCCHWYQLQSDGTHIVGGELIEKLDTNKCKLTLTIGNEEKTYDMADLMWEPDKLLSEMSLLAHFRKNDMVFMGPVDAPMPIGDAKKVVIKSNVFSEFAVDVRYVE